MKFLKLYEEFKDWDPFGEESDHIQYTKIDKNIILDNLEDIEDDTIKEIVSKKTGKSAYVVNFKQNKEKRNEFLNTIKTKYPINEIYPRIFWSKEGLDEYVVMIMK